MKAALVLLCGLIFFVKSNTAVDVGCNFYQDVHPDTTYYIYNRQYPYYDQGPQNCMWTLKGEYRVNLTCSTFQLPWSPHCTQDRLSVQYGVNSTNRYCGNSTFSVESETNMMIIRLKMPLWSEGGRFLCEVRAVRKAQEVENCRCGWKNPTRIVGGMDTGVNEYPMMAGLVDSVNRIVRCGATIIATRYVLTAAHCIINKDIRTLGIVVGEHDLSTGKETNATVLHRLSEGMIHPNYINSMDQNDIAILKTTTAIDFNNQVGPVCLPFQHRPDTFGGDFVDLLGWGFLDTAGPPSDILQKVTLSVLTPLECSKINKNVGPNQICTYAPDKDSCSMDSGGPVLWRNPTSERIVHIGVISRGVLCAVTGGVNMRTGAFVDWIVSSTPDATYCILE